MNPRAFAEIERCKKEDYKSLREEYDRIKADYNRITDIDVPKEAKTDILKALQDKVDEIKERMHNYIDTL